MEGLFHSEPPCMEPENWRRVNTLNAMLVLQRLPVVSRWIIYCPIHIMLKYYTALISSHHCCNDGNNEKFITTNVCSNDVFVLILTHRLSVASTALPTSWVPVTGDPRGIQRVERIFTKYRKLTRNVLPEGRASQKGTETMSRGNSWVGSTEAYEKQ